MELPIVLCYDTTENWEKSSTILGESELAMELHNLANGQLVKYLLVGDGKSAGPNAARLRATPEFIAGLPAYLRNEIAAESQARIKTDNDLQQSINAEVQQRQKEDQALQQSIEEEARARQTADLKLREDVEAGAVIQKEGDEALQEAVNRETEARVETDHKLEKLGAKVSEIDDLIEGSMAHRHARTLKDGTDEQIDFPALFAQLNGLVSTARSIGVEFDENGAITFVVKKTIEDAELTSFTYNPVSRKLTANKGDGGTVSVIIPQASGASDGLMTSADVNAILDLQNKVQSIYEGGIWRETFETYEQLISAYPELNVTATVWNKSDYVFVEEDENREPAVKPQTSYIVKVEGDVKTLVFRRNEPSAVKIATNDTCGVTKGVSPDAPNAGGKVYIELDGTMSVIGWDALKREVSEKFDKSDIDTGNPNTESPDTKVISAKRLFTMMGGVLSSALKTTAKTVIGAINELVDTKVTANAAVTGATKTKLTYDAKGLVTAGADATVADIAAAAVNPGTTETGTKITTSTSYSLSNWIIQILNRINWLITKEDTKQEKISAGTSGKLRTSSGTAGTVNELSSTVGSSTRRPVYINSGVPAQVEQDMAYLSETVPGVSLTSSTTDENANMKFDGLTVYRRYVSGSFAHGTSDRKIGCKIFLFNFNTGAKMPAITAIRGGYSFFGTLDGSVSVSNNQTYPALFFPIGGGMPSPWLNKPSSFSLGNTVSESLCFNGTTNPSPNTTRDEALNSANSSIVLAVSALNTANGGTINLLIPNLPISYSGITIHYRFVIEYAR